MVVFALCALLALLSPAAPPAGRAGALSALLDTVAAAESSADRELLWPGRTAAREISAGQAHLYGYVLQPDEYLRLSVTAPRTGLRASLSDPEGRALAQTACVFDEGVRLSWVALAAGEYQIKLESCEAEPAAGGYELRAEGGAATPEERARVAAEAEVVEAERLRAEFSEATSAEALRRYESALAVWRESGDRAAEAETLCDIGEVLRERGQRTAALARLEEALEAAGPPGEARLLRARILNELGFLRALMGDYREALAACERALALARDGADWRNEARALSNIGWVHYDRDEPRKSQEYQRAALRIWQERGGRHGQADALLRTGYVDAVLGETTAAFAAYERSLSLFRAVRDQRGQSLVLTAVGHLHAMTGGRQEALDGYGQAVAFSRRMEDSELTAQLCSGIGYVHHELGEFEKALEYRTQALELYRALPDRWGEASLHTSIGMTYGAMGREQEALEHYRRGLAVARSIGNARLEASLLREMGAAHERLGDTREALSHYEKSLALSRSGANPRSESSALNHIGHVHAGRGRHREALAHFRRALALSRAIHDRFSESLTLFNIARSQRDLGLLDEARAHVEQAVALVESLRMNVSSQSLRTSYFATVRRHYELHIDVLMRLRGRPGAPAPLDALAFEVSERARARSLLETLAGPRDAIRQGVDPELVERERALRRQLNAKSERRVSVLSRAHTREEAEALAAEVEAVAGEHAAVEAAIRAQSPHYAALTQPQPLGVADIQRGVLDDATVLLEYALGDERSYVWALTRAGVAGYELPGRARIEESARRLYALLTARQGVAGETAEQRRERAARADADYAREAGALGEMILGPVAGHLTEGRRLLVVADGALQYVPFGALAAPAAAEPGAQPDGVGGGDERAPLFTRHEVVSLPSASILPALRGERPARAPAPRRSVAVFADPVFDGDDARVRRADSSRPGADSSPAAAADADAEGSQSRRALREAGAPFGAFGVGVSGGAGVPRLLASREEADAIAAALPRGEVQKVTDFGASRAAATGPGLGRHRVIHFATHGILDSERPEMSGIVLSLVNERGEPQDGFLSLQDIYNLDLSADLVVLSACNTALGREVRGEGLIGLTRGFMYAGAGAVVASLWKVDDEATAELMKHFYEGMFRRGQSPPAALRQAQLAVWRQKRWRAPYYWAAFVIQGQYGELKGAGEPPVLARWGLAAWGGGAAAISFAALCAIRLRRRRRRRGLAGADASSA